LLSNGISIGGFILATLASLTLFVNSDSLLWVVGLFSAAFGLGARPFVSDYLTGLSFIFEDTFYVGDKIELPLYPQRVEGVVEKVTLRTTHIRGMDGELFIMPNGDIRLIRNFSRGEFSPTSVTVRIPANELAKTLDHLENLRAQSMTLLPNLIEPWQVISKTGELGEEAELTILAKAKFGKGAELRTRALTLLHAELRHINVLPPESSPEANTP
jgi:small conductance mechanosensitive channel